MRPERIIAKTLAARATLLFRETLLPFFLAAGLYVATPCAASSPGFSNTGSLAAARYNHTTTLLASGSALAVGGYGSAGCLASAELYNPTAGTWAATGNLGTARYGHTSTLLQSGAVLAAGGQGGGGGSAYIYLSSAELYDPAAATWKDTGSLVNPRAGHTATLLAGGQVLVAGGYNSNSYLVSAELYNPVFGTWSSTGNLTCARYNHTATLLSNGQVLVAGGGTNSAELYNPATGTWTATGDLIVARSNHTATLLPNGMVLVTGGNDGSGPLTSAELYNPGTGTWTVTGSLNIARQYHTATLLSDGIVLVTGGCGTGGLLSNSELYNQATGTWTATGFLPYIASLSTATLLPNFRVFVTGGFGGAGILANAAIYDSGLPTVVTGSATCITCTSGTLNGTVYPDGLGTNCFFKYGTTSAYGNTTTSLNMGNGMSTVPFFAAISNLNAATTYHYQMVATNPNGTVYGLDQTFTTANLPPTVTTGSATGLQYNGATLNGTVNPNGLPANAYFQYGLNTSYGSTAPTSQSVGSGTSAIAFGTAVGGLNPATLYHYRLVSTNTSGTSVGSDQAFTTTQALGLATTSPQVTLSGTTAQVSIPSLFGYSYQLQRAYVLGAPANWQNIGAVQPGTNSVLIFLDGASPSTKAAFYRLQISQ